MDNPEDINITFPINPRINPNSENSKLGNWSVSTSYGGCPNTCNVSSPFDCCMDMPCEPYRIPVVFTLLADANCGNIDMTVGDLDTFLDKVNNYYECLGVPFHFFKCTQWDVGSQNQLSDGSTRQICNNDLNLFYTTGSEDQAPNDPYGDLYSDFTEAKNYNLPNVMNIYIPGNYNGFTGAGFTHEGGVANYPTNSISSYGTAFGVDGIKNMSTNCNSTSGANVAIHEFGHWFGLAHTHGSVNSIQVNEGASNGHVECADGSQCCTKGDYICDTDPDPNLYTGDLQDTNGNDITSCVIRSGCGYDLSNCYSICSTPYPSNFTSNNIMSYGSCGIDLTECQIAKMVDGLLCARNNLSCCDPNQTDNSSADAYMATSTFNLCGTGQAIPTFTIDNPDGNSTAPPLNADCIAWYLSDDNVTDLTPLEIGSTFTPPTSGPGAINMNVVGTYTYYFDDDLNLYNPTFCTDNVRKPVQIIIDACCDAANNVTFPSVNVADTVVCDGMPIEFEVLANTPQNEVEGLDYNLLWNGLSGTSNIGTNNITADYNATTLNTVPPTLNIIGPSTVVWNCGVPYTDLGATASDDEDGDISALIITDYSNVCVDSAGTYTVVYTIKDRGGNTTIKNRSIIVVGACNTSCTTSIPPVGANCSRKQTYIVNASCTNDAVFFSDTINVYISPPNISTSIVGANTTQIHAIPDCGKWIVTWDDGQGNTGTGYTYDSDLCNSASGTVTFTVTNPDASPTSNCYQEIYSVPFVGNGIPNPPVNVKLKVFLQGTYLNSGLMETNLVSGTTSFPLSQPFNQTPWNYTGSESVSSTANIPANTVDWILVELWDALNMVVDKQAGFLLNDGSIVDVNGNVGFEFPSQTAGYFTILVRHRNHLDVMSSQMVYAPNTKGTAYDFTIPDNVKAGDSQLILLDAATSLYGLHAGDVNADGIINVMDYNQYNDESTGTTINIYQQGDCNMDSNISTTDFNTYQPNSSILGIRDIRY